MTAGKICSGAAPNGAVFFCAAQPRLILNTCRGLPSDPERMHKAGFLSTKGRNKTHALTRSPAMSAQE
ncbi:hypothetical protein AXF15_12070 [Desulfomicrobium orale DSM 12838]|uniref:Uncharacterized protein n=1 Tax=Desulfomicrobium orale DSM 12838 TaxID=888061 RepID=A0A0X8JRZ7_9BACT|nr:hypothetical protein AXF15_12070 [Desulfomicrobium orale DSM 12838]